MDIRDDIVEAVGNTPLVRLRRLHPPGNLVAKVEYSNPGGSVKDRIALPMIERAEANGWLQPGGTIVEPTSGNTGVGLAIVAALRGYRLICVMADKQSKEKQDLLRAYGAEVVVCPTDVPPDDPRSYYSVAARLTDEIPAPTGPTSTPTPPTRRPMPPPPARRFGSRPTVGSVPSSPASAPAAPSPGSAPT